jgi:hypothetical protein
MFAFGDATISFSAMEALRKGEPAVLTAMEFKMLKYLIQNAYRVISRDELLNEVWGYENYPCTRTVDNHILKLRQKLERHLRVRCTFGQCMASATSFYRNAATAVCPKPQNSKPVDKQLAASCSPILSSATKEPAW